MAEQVGLNEYLLAEIHEALRLGVTITGLPVELRELKVSRGFALFLQSILAAMFASAAERAQGACHIHVRMGWDDMIKLTFMDSGGLFCEVQESPATLELLRLRGIVVGYGGSLEWRKGGGVWHIMDLSLPISDAVAIT